MKVSNEDTDADLKHEEPTTTSLPLAPDGGWGWIVCAGAFVTMVILDGMMFSFGVLFLELSDYFQESKGKTAMVGSALMGGHLLFGPITGAMVNAWGVRPVTMTGAVIATVAFATSTLSPDITTLTVLYGLVGGVGVSMVYLPSILAVGFYFERRRALANGIMMSGSGVGTFIYSPLTSYLQRQYGWKGALMILSGVVLHCLICGALYRPLTVYRKRDTRHCNNGGRHDMLTGSDVVERDVIIDGASASREKFSSKSMDNLDANVGAAHPFRFHSAAVSPAPHTAYSNKDQLSCNSTKSIAAGSDDNHIIVRTGTPRLINKRLKLNNNMMTSSMSCDRLTFTKAAAGTGRPEQHQKAVDRLLNKPLYRKDLFYSGSLLRLHDDEGKSASVYSLPKVKGVLVAPPGESNRRLSCFADGLRMLKKMLGLSLLLDPGFLLCMLCMVLWTTHSTILTILPDYAVLHGISENDAALLLSVIGVTNTAARVLVGWISDIPRIDCIWVNVTALLLGGATCLVIPFSRGYWILVAEAGVFGACMGTWTSLRPIILVEILGLDKLTNAFGLVAMFQGMAFIIGPPIAGSVYDRTQSYFVPFVIACCAFVISGLICVPMRRIVACCSSGRRRTDERIVDVTAEPNSDGC